MRKRTFTVSREEFEDSKRDAKRKANVRILEETDSYFVYAVCPDSEYEVQIRVQCMRPPKRKMHQMTLWEIEQ